MDYYQTHRGRAQIDSDIASPPGPRADETITAIATPPGIGGIGILRLSGPNSRAIGEAVSASKLMPGKIQFRQFYDRDAVVLDHGICLYFPAPHSFTGEDCVEIQVHGGPVLLDMILQRLGQLGARLARPGEFSERAFLNGKIDLVQAEAIADLIESGSRAASRAAMRSLQGQFSTQIHRLAEHIVSLRVHIEATLDFAEEEIDLLNDEKLRKRLADCSEQLQEILTQAEQGRNLQEGVKVSLAGLPNAGKSSLLNYLAGYEAAIVTEIEGTTRDLLRERISLRGIPVKIVDTAGLRESENPVEKEGIRRAWDALDEADIVLYLIDSSKGISDADRKNLAALSSIKLQRIFSKCDLIAPSQCNDPEKLSISTLNGSGMEKLITLITGQISDYNQNNQAFMARRRHVEALQRTQDYLQQAAATYDRERAGELIAEDLRLAQQHLNEITGEFGSDDLLGKIFSSFCIGK